MLPMSVTNETSGTGHGIYRRGGPEGGLTGFDGISREFEWRCRFFLGRRARHGQTNGRNNNGLGGGGEGGREVALAGWLVGWHRRSILNCKCYFTKAKTAVTNVSCRWNPSYFGVSFELGLLPTFDKLPKHGRISYLCFPLGEWMFQRFLGFAYDAS